MKNKLLTLAGSLALLATIGHFYAKPLMAQVRAAVVANIDEDGRAPYQIQILGHTGDHCNSGGCTFTFRAVPAGHRLVVQHVSMFIQPQNAGPFRVSLGSSQPTGFFIGFFIQTPTGFDQPVTVYYDAGEMPRVTIDASIDTSAISANQLAALTGTLLDCTVAPCSAIVRQ